MKTIRRISLVIVAAMLLMLNTGIISGEGNVEEMYLTLMPEQAVSEGQCWAYHKDPGECFCHFTKSYAVLPSA